MARRLEREDARRASGQDAARLPSSPTSPRPARLIDDAGPKRGGRPRRFVDVWAFPASLGWSVAGTVVPGLGLLRTRHKLTAIALLAVAAVVLVGGVLAAWLAPQGLLSMLVMPGVLTGVWVFLVVFGILWAVSIAATHLALRPSPPTGWQRVVGSLVVGVLTLTVSAASFVGARTVYDTAALIDGVFGEASSAESSSGPMPIGNPADPWANQDRLNVLVLGGDSGQARAEELGARTDTVILASIDTRSGDVVLFSLPRQTQRLPFPEGSALDKRWPNGFTNGVPNDAEYFLNAIYDNVPAMAPDLVPTNVEDPGAEVLKLAVGEALGLEVDYYAMVNMDGFIEFVNALGGITVNINRPIPVGGKTTGNVPPDRWLPPGPDQRLNGVDALWFARGRYGSESGDYDRMSRQRCVIQAVVEQANPTTVLANYEALTKAGRNIVSTDVPNRRLPAILALSLRVKDGSMTSVSFENGKDGFSTVRPDWELVRERVEAAINPPPPEPEPVDPEATASGAPGDPGTPSESPSPTPSAASSVEDECAYNPEPLTP